jgi:hypothetical protein
MAVPDPSSSSADKIIECQQCYRCRNQCANSDRGRFKRISVGCADKLLRRGNKRLALLHHVDGGQLHRLPQCTFVMDCMIWSRE